jgi:hypothetical protein
MHENTDFIIAGYTFKVYSFLDIATLSLNCLGLATD